MGSALGRQSRTDLINGNIEDGTRREQIRQHRGSKRKRLGQILSLIQILKINTKDIDSVSIEELEA